MKYNIQPGAIKKNNSKSKTSFRIEQLLELIYQINHNLKKKLICVFEKLYAFTFHKTSNDFEEKSEKCLFEIEIIIVLTSALIPFKRYTYFKKV